MFTETRRKDRILENEQAIRLLEEGAYGYLAMAGTNVLRLDIEHLSGKCKYL